MTMNAATCMTTEEALHGSQVSLLIDKEGSNGFCLGTVTTSVLLQARIVLSFRLLLVLSVTLLSVTLLSQTRGTFGQTLSSLGQTLGDSETRETVRHSILSVRHSETQRLGNRQTLGTLGQTSLDTLSLTYVLLQARVVLFCCHSCTCNARYFCSLRTLIRVARQGAEGAPGAYST